MSSKLIKYHILIISLILGVILSACSSEKSANSDEETQVYAYANPMAENLLAAIKDNDYQSFIKDYDQAMINASPESSFNQLKQTFDTKLGEYQSYQTAGVQKTDQYTVVFYTLTFSKAPEVTMKLILHPEEPHLITGLWFNSPELNK
jgi:hypothetical protein